jgi:hypothetical protein
MGAGIQTTVTGPTYDPDAQLFFNAQTGAGVTLTTTEKDAVNQWVVDSKAAGLWTKMKAVYPLVGSTATSQKFNLKNPDDTNAAYRLAFNGGWTHSSNGALPNGTNAYASTFLIPNTVFGAGFAAIGVYVNQALTASANPIGSTNMSILIGSGFVRGANKASTNSTAFTQSPNDGFIVNSRTSSTSFYFMNRNRAFQTTTVTAVASYGTTDIVLGAINTNGTIANYSNGRIAFAFCSDFLTENESLLLYQITEKYQVALSRSVYPAQSFYYNPAYNNETNAFLFSTQITDNTIQTATNTLVSDLKTANIFTKMKAIYPMVGGTATTHKFNLVNAQDTNAAFRLSFVGGWTHSANGAKPNGTNAYANTFLWHSAYLQRDNISLSNYIRTITLGGIIMGAFGVTAGANAFSFVFTASTTTADSGGQANATNYNPALFTDTLKKGYYFVSRILNTEFKYYQNGLIKSTKLNNSSAYTDNINGSIYIGALNNIAGSGGPSNYSSSECAFATIGEGLTNAEALVLYNLVQTFQTTLGRQV